MSRQSEEANHANVLVVDDDQGIRDSLRDILQFEGYRVATAADGLEALEYLRGASSLPSLILLDLMMPNMNGWEFNEERKLDSKLKLIPIIVITATGHADDAAKPIAPVAILRKPIDLTGLLEAVKQHKR